MAYVVHSINATANGLCHHMDSIIDDAHHQYAIELTLSADALILGRNTFDLFMDFWPAAINTSDLPANTVALANAFNSIPKLIVSGRPIFGGDYKLTWNNVKHIQGPGFEKLKQELDKLDGTAVIFGSPGLASSLLAEGLIDELHVLAQPLIGVAGPQAFSELNNRIDLKLLGADSFESGVVLLRYKVT